LRTVKRVLLVSTTTGYQTRSFGDAAAQLGVELVFATDRCHQIDDPWRDAAVAVRFHDEETSLQAILEASRASSFDGVLALGDRPTELAARVAAALGLPGHPVRATSIARNKRATRECLGAAGLSAPWVRTVPLDADPAALAPELSFPCIVKPLALSGGRGVIRADGPAAFGEAFERVSRMLSEKSVRALRDPLNDRILIEGFVAGREVALEGLVERGELRTLAIFDKPDPLDGPFFEETIYVTPSSLPIERLRTIEEALRRGVAAVGLRHGPVHAECRVDGESVVILEIAARPIGGLCARALRFEDGHGQVRSLEALLLAHAIGLGRDDDADPAAGNLQAGGRRRGGEARARHRRSASDGEARPAPRATARRVQLSGIHLRPAPDVG
jgi:biotin carboxylase